MNVERFMATIAWLAVVVTGEAGMHAEARIDILNTKFGGPSPVDHSYAYLVPADEYVSTSGSVSDKDGALLVPEHEAKLDEAIKDATEVPYSKDKAWVPDTNGEKWALGGLAAAAAVAWWGHEEAGWFGKSEETQEKASTQQAADGQGVNVSTGNNSPVTVTITTTTSSGG